MVEAGSGDISLHNTTTRATTTTTTTKRLLLWSHAIESRTRYEHRRLRRVVHIVTPEGGHGMFVLLFFFFSLSRSLRSSGMRGRISVLRSRESYRFVPRDLFRGNLATTFLRHGSTGRERVLAKVVPPRKRRHCRRQLVRYRV